MKIDPLQSASIAGKKKPSDRRVEIAIVHHEDPIAQHFSIGEETVKHHLANIFDKLGVYSRLELAIFALNHGLVDNDGS